MKWHDARKEPPQNGAEVLVKGRLGCGTFSYCSSYTFSYDTEDRERCVPICFWNHDFFDTQEITNYPFYATVEEVETELDKND